MTAILGNITNTKADISAEEPAEESQLLSVDPSNMSEQQLRELAFKLQKMVPPVTEKVEDVVKERDFFKKQLATLTKKNNETRIMLEAKKRLIKRAGPTGPSTRYA